MVIGIAINLTLHQRHYHNFYYEQTTPVTFHALSPCFAYLKTSRMKTPSLARLGAWGPQNNRAGPSS